MKAIFTDIIEINMTLDTDDMKSICDNVAADFPHEDKDDFFDRVLQKVIEEYFSGYIWYNNMTVFEVAEMCPNIIEKMEEYIDWYIVHYYMQEDFKWSD